MALKRLNNQVFLVLLLLMYCSAKSFADAVMYKDRKVFGKIIKITATHLVIARSGNLKDLLTINRKEIELVIFDKQYKAHPISLPNAGLSPCETQKINLYKIYFKHQAEFLYATGLTMNAAGGVTIALSGTNGTLHGKANDLDMVINDFYCPVLIPPRSVWPKTFCFEPVQFSANWSSDAINNNKIITKGFSFYLDIVGSDTSAIAANDIKLAFGIALLEWTSPLLTHKAALDLPLKNYIGSVTSQSSSSDHILFTGPQVILVNCDCNALFIVKLYTDKHNLFPEPGYVAKAQLQGRTILLNAHGNKFLYDLSMKQLIDTNKNINLITVLVHELGHSFGLGHVSDEASIMNSNNPTHSPSDNDMKRFIAILKENIKGEKPGVFNTTRCSGLFIKK